MRYQTVMWAEMKPDIYGGKEWECSCEGDRESTTQQSVELSAKAFPPGAKITIEVPCCPNEECGLNAELASVGICPCGFNWNIWTADQYGK